MNMSALRKLRNEKTSFYVYPNWSANSFQMTVIEGLNAWHANVGEEELKELAHQRMKNTDEYYEDVKEAINNTRPNTTFDLKKKSSFTCQFLIYRKLGTSKINYFTSDLNKADFQTCVFNLIDEINSKNAELVDLLEKSEQEKQSAENEKELYEEKLQEFVELKTNWEKEIYSNFLVLLNEKKKRINFLMTVLQSKKINADEVESDLKEGVSKLMSNSESNEASEDYETDCDEKVDIGITEIQPSTSSCSTLFKPDSPPPLPLPKRIKRDGSPPPMLPTQNFEVKEEIKEEKEEIKEEKETPEEVEENSPVITFTTQDLLDRM